ncbi:hypothetical protein KP509_31G014000 [Ceratopteris richardii]|uniref:HAT C-terminal dimerisation domain-containing protein n=1 Tax=Ceratopteris richardii TaxID=49495 RepID=A0A8T2QXC6_CERRI|nr:hypothetical protein KP509_31G014000 [Ceratopteris richardii]
MPSVSSTPYGVGRIHRQQTLDDKWNPKLKEEVDMAVARFFYHDHIPFNEARSLYFKETMKEVGEYGPQYVPPTSESLRMTLLDKEKKLVEAACENIRNDTQRRSIHGVVAYSRGEMYFISSHDASETGKSADVIASEWASAIEMVDGEAANRAVAQIIESMYPHISVCFCMAHSLNNILKDIGTLDWILPSINEANALVSFINNHTRVKNEFSKRSTLCSGVLRGLLLSDEFVAMPEASTTTRKEFRKLADNAAWWENISRIVDIVRPLVHLLRVVDSMDPCIGKSLKKLVQEEEKYEEISSICVRRWNAYYSPLHAAAFMVDPEFQDKKQYVDPERLVPDNASRRLIRDQLSKYRTMKDASFSCADAQEDRFRVGAALWWEYFGFDGPEFQQLAIRILSQACTTSCLEQLWSVYRDVASEKRNRLGVQRASDLVFVSANLRMLRKTQSMASDPFTEWEMEDKVQAEEHEDEAHDFRIL